MAGKAKSEINETPENQTPSTPEETGDQSEDQAQGDGQQDTVDTSTEGGEQQDAGNAQGEKITSPEEYQRALNARLAAERKKTEKELKDLRARAAKLKEIEDADKTEQQKLQERVQELEGKAQAAERAAQTQSIRSQVIAEASRLRFADPNDALSLILAEGEVELAEDGTISDLTPRLEGILKAKPYLKGRGPVPEVPATNPAREAAVKRTDDDRRREYFGGGGSSFWPEGGG